jgi:hypothetical protein
VLEEDGALDAEKSDYEAYVESGYDRKHLTMRNGEKPTEFCIKPLTYAQREALQDQTNIPSYVIRCGLRNVENYIVQEEDGTTAALPPVELDDVDGLGKLATMKWLAAANLPDSHMARIIEAIQNITQAKLPLSAPSAPASGLAA